MPFIAGVVVDADGTEIVTAPVDPFTLVTGAVYVIAPVCPLNEVTPASVIYPFGFVEL